jgi:hypothetical protein
MIGHTEVATMSYRVIHTENKSGGDIQSELNSAAFDGYEVVPGAAGSSPIIVLGKPEKAIRATLGKAEPAFTEPREPISKVIFPDKLDVDEPSLAQYSESEREEILARRSLVKDSPLGPGVFPKPLADEDKRPGI